MNRFRQHGSSLLHGGVSFFKVELPVAAIAGTSNVTVQ